MPGDHRINFRAEKKDIELIREAAGQVRMSMVTFGMKAMLDAAKNVLAADSSKVQTSQPVQEDKKTLQPQPSQKRRVQPDDEPHPSDEISDLNERQIRVWLAMLAETRQRKEQERLEREAMDY